MFTKIDLDKSSNVNPVAKICARTTAWTFERDKRLHQLTIFINYNI